VGETAVTDPLPVVILPEVLAKSFFDADCKALLNWWRDGVIRPVLNHELLVLYARVLRDLGVADTVIRRWLLWFTAEDKATYIRIDRQPLTGWYDIAVDAAQSGGATSIVTYTPIWLPPYAEIAMPEGISLIRVTQYLAFARGGKRGSGT
jgi:hypothetical protein